MTPAARIAAAIGILDRIAAGQLAEPALTSWSRGSRYAGSGDRAAVRDHVFRALRQWRSLAALGGAETGRGLMLGALRADGVDPATVFTGQGHAPAAAPPGHPDPSGATPEPGSATALDCPDWLMAPLAEALGPERDAILLALRKRAPIHLRVNARAASPEAAAARLAGEGVAARPHPLSPNALEVTEGARRLRQAGALAEGWVELQDAGSQAVADAVPLAPGGRLLDLCAGAGGKVLAVAARGEGRYFAHDVAPARMADLPARAARAGIAVQLLTPEDLSAAPAAYDTVVVDAPCSGSGSWRRDPQGKWRLAPARLDELTGLQDAILRQAAVLAAPGGAIAYITCSFLRAENEDRIAAFLGDHPGWAAGPARRLSPLQGCDGFFQCVLTAPLSAPEHEATSG